MGDGKLWWRANLERGGEPLTQKAFLDAVNALQRQSVYPLPHHTHLLPSRAAREPGDYVCIDCGTLIHIDRPL